MSELDTGFFEDDRPLNSSFNFYKGHEHAISDIVTERLRQVHTEGWTPKHDDDHGRGELAAAASCYVLAASEREGNIAARTRYQDSPFTVWPWDLKWWKPSNSRRELVKAAALIVAEIERIDRAASEQTK